MSAARVGEVGIVGGGGAGLVGAQALLARGIEPLVYEAREGIGGNWRYDPEVGRSSCYASLVTNTSRWRTSLETHPLPRWGRTHLRHDEMLDYLEGFAERFGLAGRVELGAEVTATRRVEGEWEVETSDGTRRRHRALVVATGYNTSPVIPDWPGQLAGPVVHTHDYRTPEPFRGLDVVVVGMGCSATELACEIAGVARRVTLLARTGRDVIPHRVGRLPADLIDTAATSRLPWGLRRWTVRGLSRLAVGDLTRHGLPPPPARPGDQLIAVTSQLRHALRTGAVEGRTGSIVRLTGDHVVLDDGSALAADAILAGTGYRTEFPFLPADADPPSVAHAPLYRGVASLAVPDLFYVGIVAAHGALLPMFEAQAAWVAAVLAGRLSLPPEAEMRASVEADRRRREREFDPRWGFLFDRMSYVRALRDEAQHASRRNGSAATYR